MAFELSRRIGLNLFQAQLDPGAQIMIPGLSLRRNQFYYLDLGLLAPAP